jgi:putative addiction module CopG family antidote
MTTRKTMNVSLAPELERFVAERVASGLYRSASEVVRAALRLLEKEEREGIRQEPQPRLRRIGGAGSVILHNDKVSIQQKLTELDTAGMPKEENESKEQKAAENHITALKGVGGPFVTLAERTRMPVVFSDPRLPGNPIIYANDSFLALTGYDREEVFGKSYHFLMGSDTDPAARAQIEAAFHDGFYSSYPEVRYYRKDGSKFWAIMFISPVLNENGAVVQHFASFVDITRRRQDEDHLRFLLDELNHRTQNMLATVQAIAVQTLRGAADEEVVDAFVERILALSKAHSVLGRENWAGVGLRDVIDRILQPFGLNDRRDAHFSVEGDDVRLQPKAALTLAMVFHELATNAVKHGALSNGAAGQIDIAWQVEPTPQGDRVRLRWRESGGPPVTPPGRKGFGSRLIEGRLAQELGGEARLDYEPAGVVCQVVIPVPGGGRGG